MTTTEEPVTTSAENSSLADDSVKSVMAEINSTLIEMNVTISQLLAEQNSSKIIASGKPIHNFLSLKSLRLKIQNIEVSTLIVSLLLLYF